MLSPSGDVTTDRVQFSGDLKLHEDAISRPEMKLPIEPPHITYGSNSAAVPEHIDPPWSEIVRRFRASSSPGPGVARIYHGKSYDPEQTCLKFMRHGLASGASSGIRECIQPEPLTRFGQYVVDLREQIYAKHRAQPLGCGLDPHKVYPIHHDSALPVNINPVKYTFGVWNERGGGAGQLINPDKFYRDVEREARKGHDLHVTSHQDYWASEKIERYKNKPGNFDKYRCYGMPTPHDNAGSYTYKSLRYLPITQAVKASPLTSKREDDFRTKRHEPLGRTRDLMRDTLSRPVDYRFGFYIPPESFGVAELIHNRSPERYLKGKDKERGVMADILKHLKKAHYKLFKTTLEAFRHYDTDGSGKIDRKKFHDGATMFVQPLASHMSEVCFVNCDANQDGIIDLIEFANFLCLRDALPLGLPPPDKPDENDPFSTIYESVKDDGQPIKLTKQLDHSPTALKTTSSLIGQGVWDFPQKSKNYRQYGLRSIRYDKERPPLQRLDHTPINYGQQGDAWDLLNPTIFNHRGVYDDELLKPRTKAELSAIFASAGFKLDCSRFNELYEFAASKTTQSEVSVNSLHRVIKEYQHQVLTDAIIPHCSLKDT